MDTDKKGKHGCGMDNAQKMILTVSLGNRGVRSAVDDTESC